MLRLYLCNHHARINGSCGKQKAVVEMTEQEKNNIADDETNENKKNLPTSIHFLRSLNFAFVCMVIFLLSNQINFSEPKTN